MALLPHLLARPDTLNDIYSSMKIGFKWTKRGAYWGFCLLKIVFIDITIIINRLPFGQWFGIVYFLAAIGFTKSLFCGGEIRRILVRVFQIYFVDRSTLVEFDGIVRRYIWNVCLSRIKSAEQFAIHALAYLWSKTGTRITKQATDLVLEHADEITKTVIFATMMNGVSQKLKYEIAETLRTSGLTASISKIEQGAGYMEDAIETMISSRDQMHEDIKTILDIQWQETIALNRKIDGIVETLEHIRNSKPDQFRQLMSDLSFPYAMTTSINKLATFFGPAVTKEVSLF